MAEHVAIAGGGLAGLTCAKYLSDAGFRVSLVEGQPYLGGRASTFRDADGDWIEQGLHLFLGVYTEFQRLLCEIGQPPDQALRWTSQVRLQDPQGPQAVYGVNPLRAPIKTLLSFFNQNEYLGPVEKLSLLPMLGPGALDMGTLERAFDQMSVTDWWARIHGSPDVLERFLRPFCRAIQFTDAEQFSAFNLLGWIHHVAYGLPHNLLASYTGARDEVIFQPLARHLKAHGVSIRTGLKLKAIGYAAEAGVTGFELADGTRLEADAYVAAMPAWAFVPLIPCPLRTHPYFVRIASLPVAPAISVQIWFDRPVVDHADYTLVARTVTPVFQDVGRTAYPYARGSRLSVVLSPADDLLEKTDQELLMLTLRSLQSVEPRVMHAGIAKSVILRHPQHLIRPLPGAMSRRPPQATPVPNLFLAGDWTHQEFFGSQEGAVRGGKAAARAIVRARSPELRITWSPEEVGRHSPR